MGFNLLYRRTVYLYLVPTHTITHLCSHLPRRLSVARVPTYRTHGSLVDSTMINVGYDMMTVLLENAYCEISSGQNRNLVVDVLLVAVQELNGKLWLYAKDCI